ncbi:MAG: hypothetical protein LAQ69_21030 [Acidobacteriia bacterium]|nr:hypothetical protein [Terriglobia bacterium]
MIAQFQADSLRHVPKPPDTPYRKLASPGVFGERGASFRWMSDKAGRINVLRIMIGISIIAMPALYAAGGNVAMLYVRGLLVLWHAALREQRGYPGLLGHQERRHQLRHAVHRVGRGRHHRPRIGGTLFDKYHNYQAAFYTAAVLAAVALVCQVLAKRSAAPQARTLKISWQAKSGTDPQTGAPAPPSERILDGNRP